MLQLRVGSAEGETAQAPGATQANGGVVPSRQQSCPRADHVTVIALKSHAGDPSSMGELAAEPGRHTASNRNSAGPAVMPLRDHG